MNPIIIYTDGSSLGNPGYGGRALVVTQDKQQITTLSGGYYHVTNNQMELMAAIQALQYCINNKITSATIITDSQYVKQGIESRIHTWKKNGRRTAARKPVANQLLRQQLDIVQTKVQVQWGWTKGHATNTRNNLVDELARTEASKQHKHILNTSITHLFTNSV